MVTQKEFHKEILKTLGGENPPSEHRCPQYRYYRPGDHECPYGTVPQRLFWMCERDFHDEYGHIERCRSYLDLWAEWESNRDFIGPEDFVDEPVADRLLAYWLVGAYERYCPEGVFDLEAYFTLDNRGGCGVAGCAGFWSEKFWKTDKLVVWEIEHKRNVYTWCFDRAIYERESLAMLKDMVERHIGWNGLVSPEYDSYEEFCDDVRRLGVKGMFPEVEG